MEFDKTNEFLKFLKNRLKLEDEKLPVPGEWSNMANTIGAIAVRSGLLSLEQIESILDVQELEEEHKSFGQIAIGLGHLTRLEVDRLLAMQELNRQLSLASQLMLRGVLDIPSLLSILREYSVANSHAGADQRVEDVESLALPY